MNVRLNIYVANFELGAKEILSSSPDKQTTLSEFAGGFVAVAVPAPDIRKALDWCENALVEDGYNIRLIESIYLFDPDEKYDDEIEEITSEASHTGGVTYGAFHVYNKSELQ